MADAIHLANCSGFYDDRLSAARGLVGGSAVITKACGTGGAVTVDTVTAQLLYEIERPSVADNLALDPQAERLGEFVRARHVDVPEELLP